MVSETPVIALIGFGEAACAFVSGWGPCVPARLRAYDIKTASEESRSAMEARFRDHGVASASTAAEAVAGSGVVFSLVTADQAVDAARAAAPGLARGALWLDCNSCSPGSKRRAAEIVEAAGGRYVDVAVMSPVHPKMHHAPLLVSGPHAKEAAEFLSRLDMRPAVAGETVGEASAIKMIRSVMIKGFEALTAECFLAAGRAGVSEAVLASLQASDSWLDWRARGAYNLERMMAHGARRAAEMREVALTLGELGLPSRLASATADWQQQVADLGLGAGGSDLDSNVRAILDRL